MHQALLSDHRTRTRLLATLQQQLSDAMDDDCAGHGPLEAIEVLRTWTDGAAPRADPGAQPRHGAA